MSTTNSAAWLKQFELLYFEELDSTNNEAKRRILEGILPAQCVIRAKKQSSGRGRHGKSWDSLEGNLFFSIILPRTGPLDSMTQLSFISSLAIEKAISNLLLKYKKRPKIELKWPNDVLLNNKKLSGILIESAGSNNEYMIIGIGINITKSPKLIEYEATDLHSEEIYFTNSDDILHQIITNFLKYYYLWIAEGFLPIRKKWIKKSKALGDIISVKTNQSRISGKFIDIDFRGSIRLEVSSGQICSVTPQEVFF